MWNWRVKPPCQGHSENQAKGAFRHSPLMFTNHQSPFMDHVLFGGKRLKIRRIHLNHVVSYICFSTFNALAETFHIISSRFSHSCSTTPSLRKFCLGLFFWVPLKIPGEGWGDVRSCSSSWCSGSISSCEKWDWKLSSSGDYVAVNCSFKLIN